MKKKLLLLPPPIFLKKNMNSLLVKTAACTYAALIAIFPVYFVNAEEMDVSTVVESEISAPVDSVNEEISASSDDTDNTNTSSEYTVPELKDSSLEENETVAVDGIISDENILNLNADEQTVGQTEEMQESNSDSAEFSEDDAFVEDIEVMTSDVQELAAAADVDPTTLSTKEQVKYAKNRMNTFLKENITSSMTEYEKIQTIGNFVASFDYSVKYSSATSLMVYGKGDCWAYADAVCYMCKQIGFEAKMRPAMNDSGALSNHYNAYVTGTNVHYIVECSFNPAIIRTLTSDFCYRYVNDDYIIITQYEGEAANVVIPSTIDGYTVKEIKSYAFRAAYLKGVEVKSITLPDTLVKIGQYAFFGCSDVDSITLPKSVTDCDTFSFMVSYDECLFNNIYVEKGNPSFKSIDGVLYDITGKTQIAYPSKRYHNKTDNSSSSNKNTGSTTTSNKTTNKKKMTVKLSKKTVKYNGKKQKPSIKGVYVKGKKINSKYYTVSYKNNKNPGYGTVVVKGKGKYKGYRGTVNFKIIPKASSITSAEKTALGALKLTWKKSKGATGYNIYVYQKYPGKNYEGSFTFYEIPRSITTFDFYSYPVVGTSYVQIEAYKEVGDSKLYSSMSKVKKITFNK